jgi:DNA-binding NtrC family response regulator
MSLCRESLESLEAYTWQGNVRELENVIERIVALTEANQIALDDLPPNISGAYREPDEYSIRVPISGIDLTKTVSRIEMKMIDEALTLSNGVKAQAASLLNLNRTTLVEKMRRLGMQR